MRPVWLVSENLFSKCLSRDLWLDSLQHRCFLRDICQNQNNLIEQNGSAATEPQRTFRDNCSHNDTLKDE